MNAAKASWVVRAGIVPGHPMDEYTRSFGISSGELDPLDADQRNRLYRSKVIEAMEYAVGLQDPGRLNWVTLEWIWY